MEGAKDPDEYITKFGAARFKKLIEGSTGFIEYKLEKILKGYDLSVAEEKAKALGEACGVLCEIPSPVEREVYSGRLSELTGISKENIALQVSRMYEKKSKKAMNEVFEKERQRLAGYGDRVNPDSMKYPLAAKSEKQLLGILLTYPELRDKVLESVSEDDFLTSFHKKVYLECVKMAQKGENPDLGVLGNEFNVDEMGRIAEMTAARASLRSPPDITEISELADTLKREKKKTQDTGQENLRDWLSELAAKKK
ncbi:MAG: DnaB-like helicase N-terminal domain-containing protein [Eubacteriales bacterium]